MTQPKKLCVNLTPENNGGESVYLTLTVVDPDCISEELSLQSYGSSASFDTFGVFTSEKLFKLAREVLQFELSLREGEVTK
jgi:hypothetical protein